MQEVTPLFVALQLHITQFSCRLPYKPNGQMDFFSVEAFSSCCCRRAWGSIAGLVAGTDLYSCLFHLLLVVCIGLAQRAAAYRNPSIESACGGGGGGVGGGDARATAAAEE